MADNYNLRDATLKKTIALPNGAATVYTVGIDLGAINALRGAMLADLECLISVPALTVGEMVNADTLLGNLQCDADVAFGSARTIATALTSQLGAGGVGCAAATARFKLPSDCERYVRIAFVKTGTGNATTATGTFEILF